jgi:oligopeptide transport system ATP-binding protein
VLNLLKKFQQERQVTYLFIAHDLSIVRFISDRIGVIYKGNIVEIADAEELFNFPLHPYTRSLISAIPIPDPQLEKNKVLFTYDPSVHDYSVEQPELVEIGHNHFVYGNTAEIENYKAIRESGVPIKSITIAEPGATSKNNATEQIEDTKIDATEFALINPIHDTGNKLYAIGSFLLPVLGLIASFIFKRFKHRKNAKACMKGAIAGFATCGAILLIFLLLLLIAII